MTFLLYGANGYTGSLIARLAIERGLRPILAGRNPAAVETLAGESGLPFRIFGLDVPASIDKGLSDVKVVLHCAGPFSRTSKAMVLGCLRAKAHYLDITGEIEVFENVPRRDAEAKAAGVMLLPGAGFDVVPSDCLAAHLKRRLPDATRLRLALYSSGRPSRGTLTTVAEHLGRGSVVRRDGKLAFIPAGTRTIDVDFGDGRRRRCMTIAWGDLATAYRSTGIPNIEVYMASPAALRRAFRLSNVVAPLLRTAWATRIAVAVVRRRPEGPTPPERSRNRCVIWGEATSDSGETVAARLTMPDGYVVTARTSLACVEKVLAGHAPAGYQTPSTAYGADFILGIPGIGRVDL